MRLRYLNRTCGSQQEPVAKIARRGQGGFAERPPRRWMREDALQNPTTSLTVRSTLVVFAAASLVALTSATVADAAPQQRKQVDQQGDFVLIGNTLGWDCANAGDTSRLAKVLTGAVDCTGDDPTNDTSLDIYWRADSPTAGTATASTAVAMEDARSTAVLKLPAGARITYARLYWAGYRHGTASVDQTVTLDREGTALLEAVQSDAQWTAAVQNSDVQGGDYWYQASADVTSAVARFGTGAFRVSGVTALAQAFQFNSYSAMAGWSMVVFYAIDGDLQQYPQRNLALFDGFDVVGQGVELDASINGFLVPAGHKAKLGVVAYEGDAANGDDRFEFNGQRMSNALNPENDFFNGTRSEFGVGVSNDGDLPRLDGSPTSMGGMDLDVIDISNQVAPGNTSATVHAEADQERFVLGAFVTSISTNKPNFVTSTKSVRDINGGALRPGDVLEYVVTAVNTGNDDSENTVISDELPSTVTYLAGSLEIVTPSPVSVSDDKDTDRGEYQKVNSVERVTVRVGDGASGAQGGTLLMRESATIRFRVTVNAGATGTISNQAQVVGDGVLGATGATSKTDGNGLLDGSQSTDVVIDNCGSNADCSAPTPFCDSGASPRNCVVCVTSDDCSSSTAPDCNPSTHVCECTGGASNCLDSDTDGMTDELERQIGSNPNDADSDDDGLRDGAEIDPGKDTDGDGLINVLDPDSDNDALFDGTELGKSCDGEGTSSTAHRCVADEDKGATVTNPLQADTDGGGVRDGSEDANRNGMVDSGETNPTLGNADDDKQVADKDGDGLSDGLESNLGSDSNDRDSDDDGVLDGAEPNPSDDVDLDGRVDVRDSDSDGDGLFDGTELGLPCNDTATNTLLNQCIADADGGQTRTSAVIADTDQGGIIDGTEDRNHDGRVDEGERDPNNKADDSAPCQADSECGPVNSGRVCSADHLCIAGCRGTGGNSCPSLQTCSSTSNAIGTCNNPDVVGVGGSSSVGGGSSGGSGPSAGATAVAGASGSQTGGKAGASSDTGSGTRPSHDDTIGASVEGGGCSCRVSGTRQASSSWLLLLGGVLLLFRRRRSA